MGSVRRVDWIETSQAGREEYPLEERGKEMSAIWNRFKWVLTHLLWIIAGLIALIDPKHIDELALRNPAWSGVILFVWGILVAWANKPKSNPPPQNYDAVYPPGTGDRPIISQGRSSRR